MSGLSYKAVGFELTQLKSSGAAGWTFTGYASTFGNVDEGGDVVMPGAFSDSLKLRPAPRFLWQHQDAEPLGVVKSLTEDEHGLLGEWKISKTTRGQDAYMLLKDGAIDSLSIGYRPTESGFTDEGIRLLKSVDLLEVSLVTMPMNEQAMVTGVKSQLCPACQGIVSKAEWTSGYINDLPDSAFAYIESGGDKDSEGKTTPRSLRHFPHHDSSGKVDLPHLRNALSRAPQSPFGPKAMGHLNGHAKTEGVGGKDAAPEASSPAEDQTARAGSKASPDPSRLTIPQLRLRLMRKRRGYAEIA